MGGAGKARVNDKAWVRIKRITSLVIRAKSVIHNIERRFLLRERVEYVRKFSEKFVRGKPRGSVVLIVVDCLRYRNLSFTGYSRRTTPFLDGFDIKLRAYSASPHTYSSVPSIITGLYPHNHGAVIKGVVKNLDNPRNLGLLRSEVVTLPELLRVLGLDTLFITAIYNAALPLRSSAVEYVALEKIEASKVLSEALKRVLRSARRGKSFFAYIHLGDLHQPINPPKQFINFFGEVKPLPGINMWNYREPDEQRGEGFEEYRYNRVLLYDNTLRYVDEALRNFVEKLREEVDEPLLLIVTSDHGEEFWEHADVEAEHFYDPRGFYGVGHGHNLFNEVIEVPLLVQELNCKSMLGSSAVASGALVSLVDIVPTVLDWLGLDFDPNIFDGYSLLRGVPRDRWALSEAVAYGYEKKAFIRGKYKLLYSERDGVSWVFDLERDPFERSPIEDDELVKQMVRELKKILARDMLRFKTRFGISGTGSREIH